jgi:UDP-glucose 4-epimerase/UDP-glucuronate decarboxylase
VASPRRILLTGGAGFIGFHLAGQLAEDESAEITIADDFSRGRRDPELAALAAKPNVHLQTADLTRPESWLALEGGYDEVYHLAALIGVKHVLARPQDVIRINALATIYMLDWLVRGGGDRILFASTSEAYAWTQQFHNVRVPTPEQVPLALTDVADPRSSYAGSKIFGELAVQQYCRTHGKRFSIVRYHNVYGPRMGYEHVIPELLERALGGEDPLTVFSADHTRAFCFVSDAVDATIAAIREDAAGGETINVGNDREEIAIGELATRLLACAEIRATLEPRVAVNDPIKRRCPDLTRARALLGYEPRVALDEGLARTVEWYAPRIRSRLAG